MKHPLSSRATTKKMSLDGTVYLVRLWEVDVKEVSVSDNGVVNWPRPGFESATVPTIDGALVIHDVTQPASLPDLTGLLGRCLRSSPLIALSAQWLIDPPH